MAEQNGIFTRTVAENSGNMSTAVQNRQLDQGFPKGLLRKLLFRLYGAITIGSGTRATDGEKRILNSFTLESSLHGNLVENMDSFGWYRLMHILQGVAPAQTFSDTRHSVQFPIPLGFEGTIRGKGVRLNDSALWIDQAKLTLRYQVAANSAMFSTVGSATATLNERLIAQYEPNPSAAEAPAGDRPKLQLSYQRLQFPALTASGKQTLRLPVGDGRSLLGFALSQRNSSTDAEVSDVITADTTLLSVRHGSDFIIEPTGWTDLAEEAAAYFNITMPTGWLPVWLPRDGKLTDARLVKDGASELVVEFDNPATVSTRAMYCYAIYARPAKAGASPEAQRIV